MLFLFAKAQMYVGLGFGGELDRRPLKALKIGGKAIPDFIEHPPVSDEARGAGDYLKDYHVSDWCPKYVGALKLGANIGMKCGWNAMLEASAHLLNIAGASVNLKALIRHRVGLFAGVGAEYGYTWCVTHPVKAAGGAVGIDGAAAALEGEGDGAPRAVAPHLSAATEYAILKAGDKKLGRHEFYGLATVGTHTELGRGVALQIEGQVLVGLPYETPDVTLERKSLGADQDKTMCKLTYGLPIKLRLLVSFVKFI